MYANHRHYTLFVISFITFVVTVLGFAYIRNLVYTQSIQASQVTQEIKVIEEKRQHEQEVASAYSKFADEKNLLTSFIVPKDKVVDFIEAVEKIGADTSTKLELSGIDTQDLPKTLSTNPLNNFAHLKAHVTAVGTWPNIMRAITLLEHMHYSITFDNIHMDVDNAPTPTDEASTTPKTKVKNWSLSLDLKVLISP